MKSDVSAKSNLSPGNLFVLIAAVVFFILLRLLGWLNSPELENHDSVAYLLWAEVFRSGDWQAIVNLNPDAAPLLPLLTAIASFLPGDIEAAGRLVSISSSIATMAAVYLIGRRIGNQICGVLAIVLLAVSPHFFRMSYSILTEPLYIALFTWIVFVFISTVDKPSLKSGAALGALCGLAFLTRVEAILFILALPVLHFVYRWLREPGQPLKPVAHSNLLLVLLMAAIAAPQIIRVSAQMNFFALNGRSAWTLILSNPDGKSYDEKLSGLDYDPQIRNLQYLQTHPAELQAMVQDSGYMTLLKEYAATAIGNLRGMHDRQLVLLTGLPVLVFAVVGFLALLKSGRAADALLIVAFLAIAMVAPLLYHVTLRHLLILVPLLCVLASPGIVETANVLSSQLLSGGKFHKPVLLTCLAIASLIPLAQTAEFILEPDEANGEYNEASLTAPAEILQRFASENARPANVMSRKAYLAFLTDSSSESPPFTDLDGLLNYIDGHPIDFLFYEQNHLEGYPFVDEIGSATWRRNFRKVYSTNEYGTPQVLYAVQGNALVN